MFLEEGAAGIVFGILTHDGAIDYRTVPRAGRSRAGAKPCFTVPSTFFRNRLLRWKN